MKDFFLVHLNAPTVIWPMIVFIRTVTVHNCSHSHLAQRAPSPSIRPVPQLRRLCPATPLPSSSPRHAVFGRRAVCLPTVCLHRFSGRVPRRPPDFSRFTAPTAPVIRDKLPRIKPAHFPVYVKAWLLYACALLSVKVLSACINSPEDIVATQRTHPPPTSWCIQQRCKYSITVFVGSSHNYTLGGKKRDKNTFLLFLIPILCLYCIFLLFVYFLQVSF